jgi:hypothetical protein
MFQLPMSDVFNRPRCTVNLMGKTGSTPLLRKSKGPSLLTETNPPPQTDAIEETLEVAAPFGPRTGQATNFDDTKSTCQHIKDIGWQKLWKFF